MFFFIFINSVKVDKPVRMMEEHRDIVRTKEGSL